MLSMDSGLLRDGLACCLEQAGYKVQFADAGQISSLPSRQICIVACRFLTELMEQD